MVLEVILRVNGDDLKIAIQFKIHYLTKNA